MGHLEFGIWDTFPAHEMANYKLAAEAYDQHLYEVQLAEELGYESYYIIEHQNSNVGQLTTPSVYLCAVAQRTISLRFGVMIYQLPFYNPIRLAQEAAMLDQLSHGRLEFGTGTGVTEHEFKRWNLPFFERQKMSSEAMEIILKAWTEDEVTYQGEYWQFDEALPVPKPYQQPHPPIWVGAHSPASLEYAARNNFNVSQNLDTDTTIAEKFDLYRKIWQECEHGGPMPRTFLTRAVHVAETDEKAKAEAEGPLVASRGLGRQGIAETRLGSHNNNEGTPSQKELARVFQGMSTSLDFWLANGLALVGSPETVTRKLKEQYELMGYDIFTAAHRIGNMPQEQSLNSLKLFAQEVMPAFR